MDHRLLRGIRLSALAVTTAVLLPAWAFAQNHIEAISSMIQGGREVVRIDFKEPFADQPRTFGVQSPPRIAFDFQDVTSDMPVAAQDLNTGNLRSYQVAQSGQRTRVILNLKRYAAYQTSVAGRSVYVTLEPAATATPPAVTASNFSEDHNSTAQGLRGVDFRRTADNAGRVIVDLANDKVGVDIQRRGNELVVEFQNSRLPEGLRRRFDVTDFGTPVDRVTTTQVAGDRVRMVIEPRGLWEHSAYQSDNQFVIEVRQQKVSHDKLTAGVGYNGEKLSLNFQNIEIRALLQVIADFTNFNIVTSDTVTGAVTLRLKDVPWDQALDIILQAKGLGMKKSGNVLMIAPKEEIAAKEKKELEDMAAVEGLEPLRTQAFQLNYAKAADIAKQLKDSGSGGGGGGGGTGRMNRFLSERGTVITEPRTNQLFVTDVGSILNKVQELISKLDIPVRQVLIEARIVEATDTWGRSLGVRLGGVDLRGVRGGDAGYGNNNGRISFGGSYDAVSGQTGQIAQADLADALNTNTSSFFNLPAALQGRSDPARLALTLFSPSANRFLNLEISALEADGKGKVVSSPRVITADQTKALIEQGTELPYQEATSSGATSISFRKANLKLEVTPQITPEGNIILDVDVNKDTVGQVTPAGYAINTKHVQTQVLIENGGTVVIGGIFSLTEQEDVEKVPLLGDIPVLGNLFKSKTRTVDKQEMLIFLTPKVISDRTAIR
ncbi:secretin [Comamonas serinivorans]|uniref:Type IV pilus biogenesis and competence protein PilQ n=1 Tax=Comamonas serinivorans TaxID=1082851 RepID=A0A1Y0ER69_9BURK|nr:type IV pilus secretin PilQ [Comamonas serinivorans]ARU05998.1 secretin [Comamonas serinivorans]